MKSTHTPRMIRIVGINGSPRLPGGPYSTAKGSKTRRLLQFGLNHIIATYPDVDVQLVDLAAHNIHPDTGAYSTHENLIQIDEFQARDDMYALHRLMRMADGVILASPAQWDKPSDLMCAFINRLTYLDQISDDPKVRVLQGKAVGTMATSQFGAADQVSKDLLMQACYLGMQPVPHGFAFHIGNPNRSVLEADAWFEQDLFAHRSAQAVAENVYIEAKNRVLHPRPVQTFQEFTVPGPLLRRTGFASFAYDEEANKEACAAKGGYQVAHKQKGYIRTKPDDEPPPGSRRDINRWKVSCATRLQTIADPATDPETRQATIITLFVIAYNAAARRGLAAALKADEHLPPDIQVGLQKAVRDPRFVLAPAIR